MAGIPRGGVGLALKFSLFNIIVVAKKNRGDPSTSCCVARHTSHSAFFFSAREFTPRYPVSFSPASVLTVVPAAGSWSGFCLPLRGSGVLVLSGVCP